MRAIVIAARSRTANTIPAIAADRRVRQKPAVRTGAPAVISLNFLGTHVRMSDQGNQPTTASGVHRSERTEYRQVVEADYPHAGQASSRSSSLRPAEERMRRRIAKLTWLRLSSHHPLRVTPTQHSDRTGPVELGCTGHVPSCGGTSDIDGEGGEDQCSGDQKGDRHSEQDPLSVPTAQAARCSGEEQDQREDHGEDGVVVSTLVEHECISEAAVRAPVRGRGLSRSRGNVLLHFEWTGGWLVFGNPSSIGNPEVIGEPLFHITCQCAVALSARL